MPRRRAKHQRVIQKIGFLDPFATVGPFIPTAGLEQPPTLLQEGSLLFTLLLAGGASGINWANIISEKRIDEAALAGFDLAHHDKQSG